LENGSSELLSQAFEAHGGLEVVRLPQNGIRMEGIEALSKGLSANPNLTTLDLQDNTFTLPGSLALTSSLASWPNLTELNLSDCLLSRRGGIALATKLAEGTNPKLEVVKLQYGEMDKRTFVLLEKAVRLHGKGIKTLELNGNLVDAEDEIVEKIREALTENGHEDALDERKSSRSAFIPLLGTLADGILCSYYY
jgi:Ran GTPase-activating protein 1